MIRIDEIYNNTFWPWLEQNLPGTRMFFCDPPGHTGADALFNRGRDDIVETSYIFFHDQEPIHLDVFKSLFDEVIFKNWDLYLNRITPNRTIVGSNNIKWPTQQIRDDFVQSRQTGLEFFRSRRDDFFKFKHMNSDCFNIGDIVVSERGEYVEQIEQEYGWRTHYYFYHGWACQDWFRGYDKTFLIPRARDRTPTMTFMSPNRIVAGKRDHRVLFLYNIFKQRLEHNHISAPRVCQYEGVDIASIAQKYTNVYQDIINVFDQANLPRLFAGEGQQEMHSYRLGNFTEAADSLVYVPTETVYFGRRLHITEKTFKAIALEMPFVLVAPAGSLEYMQRYGFKTFAGVFDESYDTETNDILRLEKVTKLLKDLDSLSLSERLKIHQACLSTVEHNFNHFYNGGLTNILWEELQCLFKGFDV